MKATLQFTISVRQMTPEESLKDSERKLWVTHLEDKRQISSLYKELLPINKKRNQLLAPAPNKGQKKLTRQFPKQEIGMANTLNPTGNYKTANYNQEKQGL